MGLACPATSPGQAPPPAAQGGTPSPLCCVAVLGRGSTLLIPRARRCTWCYTAHRVAPGRGMGLPPQESDTHGHTVLLLLLAPTAPRPRRRRAQLVIGGFLVWLGTAFHPAPASSADGNSNSPRGRPLASSRQRARVKKNHLRGFRHTCSPMHRTPAEPISVPSAVCWPARRCGAVVQVCC